LNDGSTTAHLHHINSQSIMAATHRVKQEEHGCRIKYALLRNRYKPGWIRIFSGIGFIVRRIGSGRKKSFLWSQATQLAESQPACVLAGRL